MRLAVLIAAVLCTAAAQAAAPGWSTYTDAKRGFSIDYPSGWTVNPDFRDKGYRFFQGDRDDFRDGVAFSPGSDIAPGTTLQSDQLVLAVQPARPADRCTAKAFLVDPSPEYFTQTILDQPDAAQTVADAGDLYTIEHIAIIAIRTPCIAVHYYIVNARPKPRDPNAPKPVNREALLGLLNKIASSLKAN